MYLADLSNKMVSAPLQYREDVLHPVQLLGEGGGAGLGWHVLPAVVQTLYTGSERVVNQTYIHVSYN